MDSAYLFWCLYILSCVIAQSPTVILPQGRIIGMRIQSVEIFLGIPYAAYDNATFAHRFSAPTQHPGWGPDILFATRTPQRCPQFNDTNQTNSFSENCLFLNVWTQRFNRSINTGNIAILPQRTPLKKENSWPPAPATVSELGPHLELKLWGGVSLPCEELAAAGMVVVTVAYRLHALAFFTLRSLAAQGNLALLDQYLAMVWVRNNIAAFGGDPNSITLLGHSAGADSVLHHITSPRTIGYFQRAIVMSPRYIWHALGKDMHYNAAYFENMSRDMARSLGCNRATDPEILRCLRARPLSDILALYSNINWSTDMRPVPDNFLPASKYYIPNSLSAALSASEQPKIQLDILFGTTDLEAIDYSDEQYDELLKRGADYVTEYANTTIIPKLLKMFSLDESGVTPVLSQAVQWEYWGTMAQGANTSVLEALEPLGRAETAATWGAGGAQLAERLASRVSRLFVYRYSQPAGVDLYGRQINYTGAAHGTDLVTLLGDPLMNQVARRQSTTEEKRFSSVFQKYITNFVKYGSPGPKVWRRYHADNACVHELRCAGAVCGVATGAGGAARDSAFWRQYLHQLANFLKPDHLDYSGPLPYEQGESSRLRGGVFALCGVSAILLLLLCACALVLRRDYWARRADLDDDSHQSHHQ